ncbi:hypothetical protein F5Y15DRAFT_183757 [Xylariaceae sp. FL0016]|nr:hypothetical protein F5Y15DRAFT_183757 [Xylariaceae sp. FL0016]
MIADAVMLCRTHAHQPSIKSIASFFPLGIAHPEPQPIVITISHSALSFLATMAFPFQLADSPSISIPLVRPMPPYPKKRSGHGGVVAYRWPRGLVIPKSRLCLGSGLDYGPFRARQGRVDEGRWEVAFPGIRSAPPGYFSGNLSSASYITGLTYRMAARRVPQVEDAKVCYRHGQTAEGCLACLLACFVRLRFLGDEMFGREADCMV